MAVDFIKSGEVPREQSNVPCQQLRRSGWEGLPSPLAGEDTEVQQRGPVAYPR